LVNGEDMPCLNTGPSEEMLESAKDTTDSWYRTVCHYCVMQDNCKWTADDADWGDVNNE